MKTKLLSVVFIAIFMLTLLLPMVFADINGGAVSEKENRILAPRPPVSYMFKYPGDFIKQFDDWFLDNLGYREQIIALYNMINTSISNNYYLDGESVVFIGKHGHHFHSHYNQITPIYQGKPWLEEVELNELSTHLIEINNYLMEKSIPFIIMFCADKESIYPEFYPDFVIRGSEPTSLDKIIDYLKGHTTIDLFCIVAALLI